MEKGDKGSTLTRMGVSGWMFLLVPAYPGCLGQTAVKWLVVVVLLMVTCSQKSPVFSKRNLVISSNPNMCICVIHHHTYWILIVMYSTCIFVYQSAVCVCRICHLILTIVWSLHCGSFSTLVLVLQYLLLLFVTSCWRLKRSAAYYCISTARCYAMSLVHWMPLILICSQLVLLCSWLFLCLYVLMGLRKCSYSAWLSCSHMFLLCEGVSCRSIEYWALH